MKIQIAILLGLLGVNQLLAQTVTLSCAPGSTVRDGEAVQTSWSFPNAPAGTTVEINLVSVPESYSYWLTPTASNPASGTLNWTARILSGRKEEHRVRVVWFSNGQRIAAADSGAFTILLSGRPRSIAITSPVNNQVVSASTLDVTWQSIAIPDNANIALGVYAVSNSEAALIYTVVPDSGATKIGTTTLANGDYVLKLNYVNEYGVYGAESNVPFTIRR